MDYRFYTTFPVEIGGVLIGTLEDVAAIAVIETDPYDPSDWSVTGFKVIGTKGVEFSPLGGDIEFIKGEIPIDKNGESDEQKDRLRLHVEREFREAHHAIEIERMLRAEAADEGIETVRQVEHDRAIYHQSVL